jgi:hypothetical protein
VVRVKSYLRPRLVRSALSLGWSNRFRLCPVAFIGLVNMRINKHTINIKYTIIYKHMHVIVRVYIAGKCDGMLPPW